MPIQRSVAPAFPTTPILTRFDAAARAALNIPAERVGQVRNATLAPANTLRWLYASRGIEPLYWQGNGDARIRAVLGEHWRLRAERRSTAGLTRLASLLGLTATIGSLSYSTTTPIVAVPISVAGRTLSQETGLSAYLERAFQWQMGWRANVSVSQG